MTINWSFTDQNYVAIVTATGTKSLRNSVFGSLPIYYFCKALEVLTKEGAEKKADFDVKTVFNKASWMLSEHVWTVGGVMVKQHMGHESFLDDLVFFKRKDN